MTQFRLITKRSSTSGTVPPISSLVPGELAINTADGGLYYLHTSGTLSGSVQLIRTQNPISASYASTASVVLGFIESASYASYAVTASYALNGGGGSSEFASSSLSSSWASSSISSSYAATASVLLGFIESASYASYAVSASWAPSVGGSSISSSWASSSISASYAATASLLLGSITSASYALTASYAETSAPGTLIQVALTGSTIGASVFRSASFTLTTNNFTPIPFSSVHRDDVGFWNPASPTRFTIPSGADGWYVINGHVYWNPDTGLGRRIDIFRNNQEVIGQSSTNAYFEHNDPRTSAASVYFLSSSDYVELRVGENDGNDVDIQASASFALVRVGGMSMEASSSISSSFATTASYAVTASYALNALSGGGGSSSSSGSVYAGAMREIATVITSGSQSSVMFSSIAGTYRDLMIVVNGRATTSAALETVNVRFNGDSSSIYDSFVQNREGYGVRTRQNQSSGEIGNVEAATGPTSAASRIEIRISDYAKTIFRKAYLVNQTLKTAESVASFYHQFASGWWRNTAAITQIEIFLSAGGFVDGSSVTLYGIGGEVGGAALAPIYTKYDPFCPPSTPSVLNDEFTVDGNGTGAPPGFTSAGPQTPTWIIRNGKLRISSPAIGTSFSPSALEKDLPSGAFTIATFAMIQNFNPFGFVGLYLRNSSTNARLIHALAINPGAPGNVYLAYDKFSSFTARTSDNSQFIYDRSVGFLRFRSNGTTLIAEFSYDGDTWITRASENLSTHFGGDLPNKFGIQVDSYSATDQGKGSFEFLRYFPTDDADIGRMIGVGSDGAILDPNSLYLHNKVI